MEYGLKPQVDISKLFGVFKNTTNSYKYLFFLSLLDIVKDKGATDLDISPFEIVSSMLHRAWYPYAYYRLSFGKQDKVTRALDRFKSELGAELGEATPQHVKQQIDSFLGKNGDVVRELARYVIHRFMSPFFREEVRGLQDAQKNGVIQEKSVQYFYERPFPYMIAEDRTITFNRYWFDYFRAHYPILHDWASWEWAKYMQEKNPSAPAIANKLHPSFARGAIHSNIRDLWIGFVADTDLRCIFSQGKLDPDNLALDHFLPWSFVTHNEPWNLIPVDPSTNSQKSDRIPAMDRFLEPFAECQYEFLSYIKDPRQFEKLTQSYIRDLRVNEEGLLNKGRLLEAYESHMTPLANLALNQGFSRFP